MNIDTIVLKYHTPIHQELLYLWDKSIEQKANGSRFSVYRLNVKIQNDAAIKCTYSPNFWGVKQLLSVEFSVPTIINGNNYTPVNLLDSIPAINQVLAEIEGLPSIVVEEGVVHRIDIFYDHQVMNLVPYFIKALQPMEKSYRKTKPWTSEGVQFVNKQKCSKFYNKEKESDDPINHGILRQELTLRKAAIREITGKKDPKIFDLEPDLLRKALEEDLQELNLLGVSIGTADTTLQHLIQEYGELAGIFYFGLLRAKVDLNNDLILSASKLHPRSLGRRLQKIIEARVPLTLSEHKKPLPPLVITG